MKKQSMTQEKMRRTVACALARAGVVRGVLVLAAVSGGKDSVCMLSILRTLSLETGFSLAAAHVEHGIRQNAHDDALLVRSLCENWGVPFFSRRVDAPAFAKENGLSLEDAARRLRYAALRDMAKECGADLIAAAHHADDQAETVLMGLVRGSAGLLRGMAEKTCDARGAIVRPMLSIRRDDIERFVRENDLPFSEDETNRDTAYLRNFLRLRLIPAIRESNASFEAGAANLARSLRRDDAFLERLAQKTYADFVRVSPGEILFDEGILREDPALGVRAVRRALEDAGCFPKASAVEDVLRLQKKQCGREIDLGAGWIARRRKGGVAVSKRTKTQTGEFPLAVPGETKTPWGVFRVTGPMICADPKTGKNAQWVPEEMAGGLVVRSMRAGERMHPLGASGSKLLSDLLCDAGYDAASRRKMCVVDFGGAPVWIAGVRGDERCRMRPGQTAYLMDFQAK